MNQIYTFNTKDEDFKKKLNTFQKSINTKGEIIVEQSTAGDTLIITTKKEAVNPSVKNLLFDQVRRGEMVDPFGLPKILKD